MPCPTRTSQHAYMRPLGVVSMLIAVDEERGPQLYKVDPAGFYIGYKVSKRHRDLGQVFCSEIKMAWSARSLRLMCPLLMSHRPPLVLKCLPMPPSFAQATSVGTKETEATNFLEKKFKGSPQLSYDEAVMVSGMIPESEPTCKPLSPTTGRGYNHRGILDSNLTLPLLQAAIGALQNVLSEDLKPADIEVGVVRDDGERAFKVLSNDEVDHFLSALAERD